MKKRGSIAAIILGVAIFLFFITSIYIISNKMKMESIRSEHERLTLYPSQSRIIGNYIEECIKTFTKESVNTFGITTNNKDEFQAKMESNINNCFNVNTRDLFAEENIDVSFGEPKVYIEYTNTAIIVDVYLPTLITGYGIKEHINEFNYDLRFRRKVNFPIDPDTGEVQEDFKILSEDGRALLELEEGNSVTKDGQPVDNLAITITPSNNNAILGNVFYNFGSTGSDYVFDDNYLFENEVAIEIHYSEEDIPSNINEEDLEIACKDKGLWKVIKSEIDVDENKIVGSLLESAICAVHMQCNEGKAFEIIFVDTGELKSADSFTETESKGFPIYLDEGECINADLFKFSNLYINDKSSIYLTNDFDRFLLTDNSYMDSDKIIGKGPCYAPVESISFEDSQGINKIIGPNSDNKDEKIIRDYYFQNSLGFKNQRSEMTVNQRFFEGIGKEMNYLTFENIEIIGSNQKDPIGRAILKIGKLNRDTHMSCGSTPIIENFNQIILGNENVGRCYDYSTDDLSFSLLGGYPGSICFADYSVPLCTEIYYCPVYPNEYPYSFNIIENEGQSQRRCSYSYLNSEDGRNYQLDYFESGKAYCLPDACPDGDCIFWCGPDTEGRILSGILPEISDGEGKLMSLGLTCGNQGLINLPQWAEATCEYKGKNYHYDSIICKESDTCQSGYCEEICLIYNGVLGWHPTDLSDGISRECNTFDDGNEVFCKTSEGKKYRPFTSACLNENELPIPPIGSSYSAFEVVCNYNRNNGARWEKIGLTYQGDACIWLPNFKCNDNYCNKNCIKEDCINYCNNRQKIECR